MICRSEIKDKVPSCLRMLIRAPVNDRDWESAESLMISRRAHLTYHLHYTMEVVKSINDT
jgi:hypothetical protein